MFKLFLKAPPLVNTMTLILGRTRLLLDELWDPTQTSLDQPATFLPSPSPPSPATCYV